MKIISKNAGAEYIKKFQESFDKAGIFPLITDVFEDMHKESRLVSIKILSFVTFMINDLPRLFFDNLSGVRMNTMLNYINSSEGNRKDSEIVASHSKFVNSVCHCLFSFK